MFLYNYCFVYFLYRKSKKRYSKLLNKLNTLVIKNTDAVLIAHIKQELIETSDVNSRLKTVLTVGNKVIINCTFKYLFIVLVPIILIAIKTLLTY